MNIGAVSGVIGLIRQVADTERPTLAPVLEYSPKPEFKAEKKYAALERSTPEREGVSSEALLGLLERMKNDRSLDMHSIMILRHGRVILEACFGAQSLKVWKQTYSACKSVTSIAVGFAVEEGLLSLDEKIVDIFRSDTTAVSRLAMKDITVENLLTMTSTVVFAEAEALVCGAWTKAFMTSACRGTAGKTFNYNSLNTYMLAAAVVKRAGVGLVEYLTPRLFAPLGIENIFWEKSPEGIEKGGWGLYICPEDFAKIGLCFLDGGKYNGRQVIPESWTITAPAAKAEVPEDYGRFNYGYQVWCGRDTQTFLFNGMLGQNVLGFRDSGVLIVTNAGNNETFQQSSYFDMALSLFNKKDLSDQPLPENREAALRLDEYVKGLRAAVSGSFPTRECALLDGASFEAEGAAAASTGLLPLVLQVVRNNYTKGFKGISFEMRDGKFYVIYKEADAIHRFPVGFEKPLLVNMHFHGDVFRVAVGGEFGRTEDGVPVLKLCLAFSETPCTETLKIFFDADRTYLLQKETPGEAFVRDNAIGIKESLKDLKVIGESPLLPEDDYISYKIEKCFSPRIKLISKNENGFSR